MFRRLLFTVGLLIMLGGLVGCQQFLEDALDIVNTLLESEADPEDLSEAEEADEKPAESKTGGEVEGEGSPEEEESEEPEEEPGEAAEEEVAEGDSEAEEIEVEEEVIQQAFLPYTGELSVLEVDRAFDDHLRQQGYKIYRDPIGMPLPIPYQWVLVRQTVEDDRFTGFYCFDIPQEISVMANHFDHYYLDQKVSHDPNPRNNRILHTTKIDVDRDGDKWKARIDYGLDKHENTCAHVQIEAPDSSYVLIQKSDEVQALDQGRDRQLPTDYQEVFQRATSADHFHKQGELFSVKEAIYEEEAAMLPWLSIDVPHIFPYNSYLIRDVSGNEHQWEGLVCTDVPIHLAAEKHLSMLENYNADIEYFELLDPEENTSMLKVATMIDFAFNDEYGTGHWSGSTYFYRYEEGQAPFTEQQCMNTGLNFHAELLP